MLALKITVDFEKSRLNIIFRDYEISLLELLVNMRKIDSRAGYNYVKNTHGISRATVINSLKKFTDMGLVTVETESTKGGWKGIYILKKHIINESNILNYMFNMLMNKFYFESEGIKGSLQEEI